VVLLASYLAYVLIEGIRTYLTCGAEEIMERFFSIYYAFLLRIKPGAYMVNKSLGYIISDMQMT
jgi:hypothetical protein